MGTEPPLDPSGSSRLSCDKTGKINHHMVYRLVLEGKNVFSISRTAELEGEAATLALHHWAVFRLKQCLIRWRRFISLNNSILVSQASAKEQFRRTLLRSAFLSLSLKFSSSLYLKDILAEGEATNYRKVGRQALRQWVQITKTFQLQRFRHGDSCVVAIHGWRMRRKRIFFSTMYQVLPDRGRNREIAKKKCLLAIQWRQKNALRYGLDMIMRHIRNAALCRNKVRMASMLTRKVSLSCHLQIWKSFTIVRAQLTRRLSGKVFFLHGKRVAIRHWMGIIVVRKRLMHEWCHLLRIALFYWKHKTSNSSAKLLNIRGIAKTLTLDNNGEQLQQYISLVNIREHEKLRKEGICVRTSDMAVGIAALSHLNHLACCEKLRLAQSVVLQKSLRLFEKKTVMMSMVREAEKKTFAYALVAYHARGLRQWQVKSSVLRSMKTRVVFFRALQRRHKAVRMIQLWAEECKRWIHWCVMKTRASSMADRSCGSRKFKEWRSVLSNMHIERLCCAKATALGDLCVQRRAFSLFIQGVYAQQHQRSQTALALHWWKNSMQRRVWGAFVQHLKERRLKRKQASHAAGIWHMMLLRDGAAQWALAANKAQEQRLSFSIRQEKEKASSRWVLVDRCAQQWRKTVLRRRKTQKAAAAPTRSALERIGGNVVFTGTHVKRTPPPSLSVPLWRCNAESSSAAALPLPPQRKNALPRSIVPITPTDPVMSFSKISTPRRPPPRRPLELLFDTLDSSSSSARLWVINELNHRHPHGGNSPVAFPQPPSVGDKSGITAAASFSQSESQTNKDAQQLQWKDDTHEGIRSETSFTCNSEGREEMVLKPRSNTYNTDELENMTMQISHGSGPSSSNAVEKGIAEKQAHLTLGLGQSVFCNEERIEKDEARRLVGEHAAAAALRGRMDSQQWCRGSVNQDGVAKEDDAASDRSIDNASSGAGLPPFETEVRMMNEDGNPAITTDQDVSKHCTSMKDVVRDTSDIGMLSSVAPRRRLQETLAQLEWWIDEWQRKKEIYQQDKVHLEDIHDKFEDTEGNAESSSVLASTAEKPCDTQWSIAAALSRIEDYRIFKSQAACEVSRIQNQIACLELEVLQE